MIVRWHLALAILGVVIGLGSLVVATNPGWRRRAGPVAALTAAMALVVTGHAPVLVAIGFTLPVLVAGRTSRVRRLAASITLAVLVNDVLGDPWPVWPSLLVAGSLLVVVLPGRRGMSAEGAVTVAAAVGLWLCVPDTEVAVAALGVVTAIASGGPITSWRHRPPRDQPFDWSSLGLLVVWAGSVGAQGRPAAAPLAVFAAAVIIGPTLATGRVHRAGRRPATWGLAAASAAGLLVAARTVGLGSAVGPALAVSGAGSIATIGAGLAAGRRTDLPSISRTRRSG